MPAWGVLGFHFEPPCLCAVPSRLADWKAAILMPTIDNELKTIAVDSSVAHKFSNCKFFKLYSADGIGRFIKYSSLHQSRWTVGLDGFTALGSAAVGSRRDSGFGTLV